MYSLALVTVLVFVVGCEPPSLIQNNGECVVHDADGNLTIVALESSECTVRKFLGEDVGVAKIPAAISPPSVFPSRIANQNGEFISYVTVNNVLVCGRIRQSDFTKIWQYSVDGDFSVRNACTSADGKTIAAILSYGGESKVVLLSTDGIRQTFKTGTNSMPEQIRMSPDSESTVVLSENAGPVRAFSAGSDEDAIQISSSTLWPRLLNLDGGNVIHGDVKYDNDGTPLVVVQVGQIRENHYEAKWSITIPRATPQDGFMWEGDLILRCLDQDRNSQILRVNGDLELKDGQTRSIQCFKAPRGWMICDVGAAAKGLYVLLKKDQRLTLQECVF